jgi:pimeloyl-ACP methyl ester carboxylesterase
MLYKTIPQEEKRFIDKIIGPQLQHEQKTEVIVSGDQTFSINYCIISNGSPLTSKGVIVLITGFGSGWTGIAKLGYELAKLGYQVFMISLPGYGNSDNPFPPYYKTNGFNWEAEILAKFAKKILPNCNSIHWVGHSMGSAIITELACLHPKFVKSLVFLNPAGFEKRGYLEVAAKLILNGMMHWFAFYGDPAWNELKKFLPKERCPFSLDRIEQRISEWERTCSGLAMSYFKLTSKYIPFRYITSTKDFVYPFTKSALVANWMDGGRRCFVDMLPGLWHNTTQFGSEITAKAIDNFLSKL